MKKLDPILEAEIIRSTLNPNDLRYEEDDKLSKSPTNKALEEDRPKLNDDELKELLKLTIQQRSKWQLCQYFAPLAAVAYPEQQASSNTVVKEVGANPLPDFDKIAKEVYEQICMERASNSNLLEATRLVDDWSEKYVLDCVMNLFAELAEEHEAKKALEEKIDFIKGAPRVTQHKIKDAITGKMKTVDESVYQPMSVARRKMTSKDRPAKLFITKKAEQEGLECSTPDFPLIGTDKKISMKIDKPKTTSVPKAPALPRTPKLSAKNIRGMAIKSETITEPAKELIDEHKRLVHVLETPSKKDDKKEAKIQEKELKEYEAEAKKSVEDPAAALKRKKGLLAAMRANPKSSPFSNSGFHKHEIEKFAQHVKNFEEKHFPKNSVKKSEEIEKAGEGKRIVDAYIAHHRSTGNIHGEHHPNHVSAWHGDEHGFETDKIRSAMKRHPELKPMSGGFFAIKQMKKSTDEMIDELLKSNGPSTFKSPPTSKVDSTGHVEVTRPVTMKSKDCSMKMADEGNAVQEVKSKEDEKKAKKESFVSKEISHLVHDKGYPQKRAVAAAINVAERKHKL